MDFNLKNKQIIVTAAGNGIGRAACIALHKEGAKIIAVDNNKNALKSNWASDEGKNSKAFIDMVEQIADSTASGADIHVAVTLNNHRED